MSTQGRTSLILIIILSILIHVGLVFTTIYLNKKEKPQVNEYHPTYIYNVTVNVTNPPVKDKPEEKPKVEAKPKTKAVPKEEPKQEPKKTNGTISSDTKLLAHIINAEAKGEPYSGKVAVGNVIMNRVEHPQFPDTVKGVIYQKGQFSPVSDGSINREPDADAIKAAKEVMNGKKVVGEDVLYFYNPKTSTSDWIFSREVVTTIGDHAFAS